MLDFSPVYRGGEGGEAPVLHTAASAQKLNERMQSGRGARMQSPHDTVQDFLNASGGGVHRHDRWVAITNGILLLAELDELYAHLYGLTREELAYILGTFSIVRSKDEARTGEFRTKRLVLAAYESLITLRGNR